MPSRAKAKTGRIVLGLWKPKDGRMVLIKTWSPVCRQTAMRFSLQHNGRKFLFRHDGAMVGPRIPGYVYRVAPDSFSED